MKCLLLLAGLAALAACSGPDPAISARVASWKSLGADDDVSLSPRSALVTYPSAEEWAQIQKRRPITVDDKDDE